MSKVKVKARISPREQGIKVHFKSFDVDDPSSDTALMDADGLKSRRLRYEPKRD